MVKSNLILLLVTLLACMLLACAMTENLTIIEYSWGFTPELIREKPFYIVPINVEKDVSGADPDSIFIETWGNYLPYIKYEIASDPIKKPNQNLLRKLKQKERYRYILIPYLKFPETENDKSAVQLDIKVWDVTFGKIVWHTTDMEQDKIIGKAIRKACAISIKAMPCYLNMGRPGE